MHYYKIGWHDGHDQGYTELSHLTKFSQEEFDEIISDVIANLLTIVESHESHFYQLLSKTVDILVKDHGFEKHQPTFEASFEIDGSANLRRSCAIKRTGICNLIDLVRNKYRLLIKNIEQ